jgi:hypothetical protein
MIIAWQWYTVNGHAVARDGEENNKPGLRQTEWSGPAISSCQDQSFRASDGRVTVEQERNHPYQTTKCSRYEFSQDYRPPTSACDQ